MAYDSKLELRIDKVVESWGLEIPKRKMFGGLGYFINRNMAFGIKMNQLIAKAHKATTEKLLADPGVGYFEFGGKYMKSWLQVESEVLDDENLERYLEISRDYVLTLPPK